MNLVDITTVPVGAIVTMKCGCRTEVMEHGVRRSHSGDAATNVRVISDAACTIHHYVPDSEDIYPGSFWSLVSHDPLASELNGKFG